ncbi:MAG: flavin reductase family protein [Actinomycetota bacterium]
MTQAGNPFLDPVERRVPARRFRGRLTAPVTLWTGMHEERRAGLTVSSLLVVEGAPSSVVGLVNPTADLWEVVEASETFVVHVLERRHRVLAQRFAGSMPSPGGPFEGLDVERSAWGPVLTSAANRAFCRLAEASDLGYQVLVRGTVERVDVDEFSDPLVYLQGRYRRLASGERS